MCILCLIIDFVEYNDEAREYLNSKPKLLLMLAGEFLEKILGKYLRRLQPGKNSFCYRICDVCRACITVGDEE